jgi:hypothetical protein
MLKMKQSYKARKLRHVVERQPHLTEIGSRKWRTERPILVEEFNQAI